jgi:hypothetical protein
MTANDHPTYTLITSEHQATGLISKARELANEIGGNFRAPHYTASAGALGGEMALAAGGTLLIDQPADFSHSAINTIASIWCQMDPACRPEVIVTLLAEKTEQATQNTARRFQELFRGWERKELHIVEK